MKLNCDEKLLNEIEKYFSILAKSRSIQMSIEKKIKIMIEEARSALK